jgi:NTE family protein
LIDVFRRAVARRRGIVLALGGGGARGLAHIGVLSALEELGIPVRGIAGTSAGAVVGAMWLTLGRAAAVADRWRQFLDSPYPHGLPDVRLTASVSSHDNVLLQFARRLRRGAVVALALDRRFMISHEQLAEALAFLLPEARIEELRLPFAVVATDFFAGRAVVLREGSLRDAALASSSIPGVLPPYRLGGQVLIDGGTVAEVPVDAAEQLGGWPVVAVDVGEAPAADHPDTVAVPRALLRGGTLTHAALRDLQTARAGLVLRPNVGDVHWSEFTRLEALYAEGRRVAQAAGGPLSRLAARGRRGAWLRPRVR